MPDTIPSLFDGNASEGYSTMSLCPVFPLVEFLHHSSLSYSARVQQYLRGN